MALGLLGAAGSVAQADLPKLPCDEMRFPGGGVRAHYRALADWLERTPSERIAHKRAEAERAFHRVGITFAVYGEDAGSERLIPFDLVPRIIPADEWRRLEAGLVQRVHALNLFLADLYHAQPILRAGVIPAERVLGNAQYRPEMVGLDLPAVSMRTSQGSTSSGPGRASTTSSRTTCASRPAFRTCSRTAR